jgi:hypothetical protein
MTAMLGLSRIVCALVTATMLGCAPTIGAPNLELLGQLTAKGAFREAQSVRICGLHEAGVSAETVRGLIDAAWNDQLAATFGLEMRLTSLQVWRREGSDIATVLFNVQAIPVAAECDRVFAFMDQAVDFRDGELVGAVSLSHGVVLATRESLAHASLTPIEAVRHELYHLVGCGHAWVMDECYRRIALAKQRRKSADAFFPVPLYLEDEDIRRNCGDNPLIDDRGDANRIAQRWVAQRKQLAAGEAPPARPCTPKQES